MKFAVMAIYVVFLLVLLGGCSLLNREDLFENGRYRVEVDVVENCTLEASSYERDGRFVVEGRMTLRHHRNAPLSGDVTAKVFGPQGKLLEVKTAPFEPHSHARHIHPAARFELMFDQIPPPNSIIKLSHTLRRFDGSPDERVIR